VPFKVTTQKHSQLQSRHDHEMYQYMHDLGNRRSSWGRPFKTMAHKRMCGYAELLYGKPEPLSAEWRVRLPRVRHGW